LELLQLGVLRLALFQDGNIGVGVFPEREEILVRGARHGDRLWLVEDVEAWARASPLQHGELLAKHEVLEDKIVAAAKQADPRAEP
jgi:cytochrome oxidase assembly protein ShyY1